MNAIERGDSKKQHRIATVALDENLQLAFAPTVSGSRQGLGMEETNGSVLTLLDGLDAHQRRELAHTTSRGESWSAKTHVGGRPMTLSLIPARGTSGAVVGFLASFLATDRGAEDPQNIARWKRAVVDASDRERLTVSRLLHDGLWPHILGAAFLSRSLATKAGRSADLADGLEKLNELIHSAVQQSKNILRMDAASEQSFSLREALEQFSRQFSGGRQCQFIDDPAFPEFASPDVVPYSRVIEEVVLQAFYDFHATRAVIRLEHGDALPRIVVVHDGDFAASLPAVSEVIECRLAQCGGAIGWWPSQSRENVIMILCPPYVAPSRN